MSGHRREQGARRPGRICARPRAGSIGSRRCRVADPIRTGAGRRRDAQLGASASDIHPAAGRQREAIDFRDVRKDIAGLGLVLLVEQIVKEHCRPRKAATATVLVCARVRGLGQRARPRPLLERIAQHVVQIPKPAHKIAFRFRLAGAQELEEV